MFWHEDCLKCGCCDARLGEVGHSLYTKGNLLLCKRDYLRWLTVPPSIRHLMLCDQAVWLHGLLRGVQQGDPGLRDGDEGEDQCVSPGVLCVPAVRPQVSGLGPRAWYWHFQFNEESITECYLVRFCVGDQFYLYDNKILCGPDYEERILFANLHQHPDRIAQIKNQTRLMPPGSSSLPHPPSSSSTSASPHPGYSQPHPSHGHPPGYSFPSPGPGAPPPSASHPKCANLNPLPPISSVKSLAKRTALAI